MILIRANWLSKLSTLAFTVWPFIFIRDDKRHDERTIRHETIHLKQQREMLIVFFFLWYYIEYCIRAFRHGWHDAYYKISFEREAYDNENDSRYLVFRNPFAWIKYL